MDIGDKIPDVLGIDQNGKEIRAGDFAEFTVTSSR